MQEPYARSPLSNRLSAHSRLSSDIRSYSFEEKPRWANAYGHARRIGPMTRFLWSVPARNFSAAASIWPKGVPLTAISSPLVAVVSSAVSVNCTTVPRLTNLSGSTEMESFGISRVCPLSGSASRRIAENRKASLEPSKAYRRVSQIQLSIVACSTRRKLGSVGRTVSRIFSRSCVRDMIYGAHSCSLMSRSGR